MSLEEKSYTAHQNVYADTGFEKELEKYKTWFNVQTTDLWRHKRMLSVLNPFLEIFHKSTWLTVGDGRFGTSATYINNHGGDALASDIDTRLLEMARQNAMVKAIAFANAEKMPFADEQFDFSYCKLSYHHFPRPSLAVYEMLRVSKKAVIFTEPHDYFPPPLIRGVFQKIKHFLKRLMGSEIVHHDTGNFEEIGNYVYTISVRELEKMAQGIGLPCIAYKMFHDAYIPGVEDEQFSKAAPLYKKIKREIAINRIKNLLGIANPNNIQAIIFKTFPPQPLLDLLKRDGYTIVVFPQNPYL